MRRKSFDCCSILSETHGLKQQKNKKIGINRLGNEIVFVAGDRVITRSSSTDLKLEIDLDMFPFRLDIRYKTISGANL